MASDLDRSTRADIHSDLLQWQVNRWQQGPQMITDSDWTGLVALLSRVVDDYKAEDVDDMLRSRLEGLEADARRFAPAVAEEAAALGTSSFAHCPRWVAPATRYLEHCLARQPDQDLAYGLAILYWRQFGQPHNERTPFYLERTTDLFSGLLGDVQVRSPPEIAGYFSRLAAADQEPDPRPFLQATMVAHKIYYESVLSAEAVEEAALDLCRALTSQGELTKNVSDLDEAVTIAFFHQHAGRGDSGIGHAFWVELVRALSCRAFLTQSPTDVDQVLAVYSEDELSLTDANEVDLLSGVCSVTAAYGAAHSVNWLLDRLRRTASAPTSGPSSQTGRVHYLLSVFWTSLYARIGDPEAIENAEQEAMAALAGLSHRDEDHWLRMAHLSEVYYQRYTRDRAFIDLQRSITHLRHARRDSERAREVLTRTLVRRLQERYRVTGDPDSAREAAQLHFNAQDEAGGTSAPEAKARAFADAYRAGLIKAEYVRPVMEALQSSIDILPADNRSDRWRLYLTICAGYRDLFDSGRSRTDLDVAEAAGAKAMDLAGDPEERSMSVRTYAALKILTGTTPDFRLAHDLLMEAVELPTSGTERALCHYLLIGAEQGLSPSRTLTPEWLSTLTAASAALSAPDLAAVTRKDLAQTIAYRYANGGEFGAAAQLFRMAVSFKADLGWASSTVSERQTDLLTGLDLVRDGAACAVRAGSPDVAVDLFGVGRGLFWADLLQRQHEISAVAAVDPDTATTLRKISRALRGLDDIETTETTMQGIRAGLPLIDWFLTDDDLGDPLEILRDPAASERITDRWMRKVSEHPRDLRLNLRTEWSATLDQFRARHPTHETPSPFTVERLRRNLGGRTLVILNASHYGGSAVILHAGATMSVALSDRLFEESARLALRLGAATIRVQAGDVSAASRAELRGARQATRSWFWQSVVTPVLDRLSPTSGKDGLPHILWYLTGAMSTLPLHAATSSSGEWIGDLMLTSYITTLGSVLSPEKPGDRCFDQLLVVDPSADGSEPALAGVDREVEQISAVVSSAQVLRGQAAHAAALTRYAAEYPNVHLACHAIPNTTRWGPARMFLADGVLRVSDVAGDRFPDHSRLAYLSCCFAAADVVEPTEDPQHLAAAFQALGYRDVVGALWAASDRWAARLAPRFYAELVADHGDAGDPVAGALHRALTSLREIDEDALFHAPFVHFTT